MIRGLVRDGMVQKEATIIGVAQRLWVFRPQLFWGMGMEAEEVGCVF